MVNFETIRFPLIFGGFLLAAGTTFIFRDRIIPDMEDERKKIFRASEENRKQIQDAIKAMKS